MGGLAVTGMNNGTSWGLYIACFMFFVGLSAGGLIVASSASVFHIAQVQEGGTSRDHSAPRCASAWLACSCSSTWAASSACGVCSRGLISPRRCSGTCALSRATWLLTFCTWCSCARRRPMPATVEVVSRFALPVAILVHSVTAWIFGLQLSREGWYSAIMAPLFVVSAMDSGLALLLLALAGLNKSGLFKTDTQVDLEPCRACLRPASPSTASWWGARFLPWHTPAPAPPKRWPL